MAATLLTYGWAALILAVWVGLSVGSFLNVVIYRFPVMLTRQWEAQAREVLEQEPPEEAPEPFNLMVPRSRCPACQQPITAWQNIPVFSWLLLKGRCRACGTKIPARYPMVELRVLILLLQLQINQLVQKD